MNKTTRVGRLFASPISIFLLRLVLTYTYLTCTRSRWNLVPSKHEQGRKQKRRTGGEAAEKSGSANSGTGSSKLFIQGRIRSSSVFFPSCYVSNSSLFAPFPSFYSALLLIFFFNTCIIHTMQLLPLLLYSCILCNSLFIFCNKQSSFFTTSFCGHSFLFLTGPFVCFYNPLSLFDFIVSIFSQFP